MKIRTKEIRFLKQFHIDITLFTSRQNMHESHRTFLWDKTPIYILEDTVHSLVIPKDKVALTLIPQRLHVPK